MSDPKAADVIRRQRGRRQRMSDLEILEDPRAPNGLVWKGLGPGTHVWAPVGSSMRPSRI